MTMIGVEGAQRKYQSRTPVRAWVWHVMKNHEEHSSSR